MTATTATANYDFTLDGKAVEENGVLKVAGYASNYDLDRVGDVVTRQALEQALNRYMQNPMLLWNHQYSRPAGRVTAARIDQRGLYVEAELPRPAERDGQNLTWWQMVRDGYVKALSIGGKWVRDAANRLIEIDLREVSLAAVGVNSSTLLFSAQMAKAFGDGDADANTDLRSELRMLQYRIETERVALRPAILRAVGADFLR
jgi:HK97 family phage prohead protease